MFLGIPGSRDSTFSKSERRENKQQLLHKAHSDAIVSTLTACFLLLILIYNDFCVSFCVYYKTYYKNDWFFFKNFVCKWEKEEVLQCHWFAWEDNYELLIPASFTLSMTLYFLRSITSTFTLSIKDNIFEKSRNILEKGSHSRQKKSFCQVSRVYSSFLGHEAWLRLMNKAQVWSTFFDGTLCIINKYCLLNALVHYLRWIIGITFRHNFDLKHFVKRLLLGYLAKCKQYTHREQLDQTVVTWHLLDQACMFSSTWHESSTKILPKIAKKILFEVLSYFPM